MVVESQKNCIVGNSLKNPVFPVTNISVNVGQQLLQESCRMKSNQKRKGCGRVSSMVSAASRTLLIWLGFSVYIMDRSYIAHEQSGVATAAFFYQPFQPVFHEIELKSEMVPVIMSRI